VTRLTAYTAPQELHDLAFRYGDAVDRRDACRLGAIFTSGGVIGGYGQAGVRYCGAEGWQQMIDEVSASFAETMHNVFNQVFERDGEGEVCGITTGIASHIIAQQDGKLSVLDFAMRYHNHYAIEHGEWKFSERRLEVVWVETRPASRFSTEMFGRELSGFQ
jgi:hypothetical protein